MTGKQRENLARRVASLTWKMEAVAGELRRVLPASFRATDSLYRSKAELVALLDGPLAPTYGRSKA